MSAPIRTDTDVLAATQAVFDLLLHDPQAVKVPHIHGSGYDSDDDPTSLVGLSVQVKWSGEKWYAGVVRAYAAEVAHPEAGKHQVVYADGDKKWYQITEKNFKIVAPA
jgi:hypothetical protein